MQGEAKVNESRIDHSSAGEWMSGKRRFLSALFGGRTDRISVGFTSSFVTLELMEQTEASLAQAHLDPAASLRLCHGAVELFKHDAVCPTYAVTHEAAALGQKVDWGDRENFPIGLDHPVQEPEDIKIPEDFLEKPTIRPVLDMISLAKKELGDRVAIVGKVMGAWTLLYHLHGVEQSLMDSVMEPDKIRRFIEILMQVPIMYGKAQIQAGADCVQIGDHAPRDLTRPEFYRDFLLPYHRIVTREMGCPILHHCCGNTVDRLQYYVQAGFDCFHLDTRVDAFEARRIVGDRMSLVGGINNPGTLLLGTTEDVKAQAKRACDAGLNIIASECAIPVRVPNANLIAITEGVQEYCREKDRMSRTPDS
jgi:MtaA/CmuA family methyltransferase